MDLCNKYRPKGFGEILGQSTITKSLKSLIDKDNKLPNCLLLIGSAGTGKTSLARVCTDYSGCLTSDRYELNAADTNSTEDMRALAEQMQYRSLSKCGKVAILDECQKITSSAWNVLLKPLEETVYNNTYILCSTDPNKIPKAILTRCTRYDLKPVPNADILNHLKYIVEQEKFTVPKQILTSITVKSEGSPRLALKLLEKVHNETDIVKANELIKATVSDDEHPAIDLARVIAKQGSWGEALSVIKSLDEDNEGIRLMIINYISKCIYSARSMEEVEYLVNVLNAFRGPFISSEHMAPILLSTAMMLIPTTVRD